MRARTLALIWLVVGAALWCGIFDVHIARGADDYLRRQAQYELGILPDEPSMVWMMSQAKRRGATAASLWTALVVGLGWATIGLRGGVRPRRGGGSL
jgi:hypothetical protein